jgi:hypothetical protein
MVKKESMEGIVKATHLFYLQAGFLAKSRGYSKYLK